MKVWKQEPSSVNAEMLTQTCEQRLLFSKALIKSFLVVEQHVPLTPIVTQSRSLNIARLTSSRQAQEY